MNLGEFQGRAQETNQLHDDPFVNVVASMLGLASETGSIQNIYKKFLREKIDTAANRDFIEEELGALLWYVAAVATAFDLSMETIAAKNLLRTHDYFAPQDERDRQIAALPVLDAAYPPEERFPRLMEFDFSEVQRAGGRIVVALKIVSASPLVFAGGSRELDGKRVGFSLDEVLGNSLTDNARRTDGYRYHDAIHLGFVAALGWSPTMRQLLRLKRKSDPATDEGEDGARAVFAEEGLAAVLARLAIRRLGFGTETSVDMESVEIARAVVTDLECAAAPAWLWRRAISQGFQAMAALERNGGGRLLVDLDRRTLTVRAAEPEQAESDDTAVGGRAIVTAIAALHRAKDAAYGDAWRKRGEVISVISNIARKVDRLENLLGGATATADESLLDTAVDLFVYVVKYCAFLADESPEVDAQLFPGATHEGLGRRSDGYEFVETLFATYCSPITARDDLRLVGSEVVRAFADLEISFGTNGWDSPTTRLERAEALANLAWEFILVLAAGEPDMLQHFIATNA